VVDAKGCHRGHAVRSRGRSGCGLDRRVTLDTDRVHPKRTTLWPHALPLHGTFLSRDDRTSHSVGDRHFFRQFLQLARTRSFYTHRWLEHLVGHGASVGEILIALTSAFGVKRTCPFALHMSANDPKRTSERQRAICDALFFTARLYA